MKWKGAEVTKIVCTHARGVYARSYQDGKLPLTPGKTYSVGPGKDLEEADARYLMAQERAAPAGSDAATVAIKAAELPVPSGEKSDDEAEVAGGRKK
jgi:hypothetical protein